MHGTLFDVMKQKKNKVFKGSLKNCKVYEQKLWESKLLNGTRENNMQNIWKVVKPRWAGKPIVAEVIDSVDLYQGASILFVRKFSSITSSSADVRNLDCTSFKSSK